MSARSGTSSSSSPASRPGPGDMGRPCLFSSPLSYIRVAGRLSSSSRWPQRWRAVPRSAVQAPPQPWAPQPRANGGGGAVAPRAARGHLTWDKGVRAFGLSLIFCGETHPLHRALGLCYWAGRLTVCGLGMWLTACVLGVSCYCRDGTLTLPWSVFVSCFCPGFAPIFLWIPSNFPVGFGALVVCGFG